MEKFIRKLVRKIPCIRCSITSSAERGETQPEFLSQYRLQRMHSYQVEARHTASLNRLGDGFVGYLPCEQRYLGTTGNGFLRKQLQAIYSASSAALADPTCGLLSPQHRIITNQFRHVLGVSKAAISTYDWTYGYSFEFAFSILIVTNWQERLPG